MSKKRKNPARPAKSSASGAMVIATDADQSIKKRVAAIAETPLAVCESDQDLQAMLQILRDEAEPVEVRLAALQALQAASFSATAFEPCRSDYLATLREVADDPDPELRQRVLGLLVREKDGFAQKRLLDGLQKPEKALVPPEKALQLLSYDVHAEAYPVARAIVSRPPNATARREALRLLAADAASAPMYEKILRDKKESPEIRRLSASALHSLKPDQMLGHAREILMDKSEGNELQAACLTALTQFGDAAKLAGDAALLESVDRLGGTASKDVKQGARRFLDKYGK